MSIRMMPMDYVFSRFPRLIRDLSAKLGKQVELVTFGKDTELDKGLIERIDRSAHAPGAQQPGPRHRDAGAARGGGQGPGGPAAACRRSTRAATSSSR